MDGSVIGERLGGCETTSLRPCAPLPQANGLKERVGALQRHLHSLDWLKLTASFHLTGRDALQWKLLLRGSKPIVWASGVGGCWVLVVSRLRPLGRHIADSACLHGGGRCSANAKQGGCSSRILGLLLFPAGPTGRHVSRRRCGNCIALRWAQSPRQQYPHSVGAADAAHRRKKCTTPGSVRVGTRSCRNEECNNTSEGCHAGKKM